MPFRAQEATGNVGTSNMALYFGNGSGQLGLSILRVAIPSNSGFAPGVCTSVGSACLPNNVTDMQQALSYGARIYASPWTPPAHIHDQRQH
jgi:O-glycosyl hydrolase